MISSRTRQRILEHTYYSILHRTNMFNIITAELLEWENLADALQRTAEAIRVQYADYLEARDFEEEAARQAETEYAAEKNAEPLSDLID